MRMRATGSRRTSCSTLVFVGTLTAALGCVDGERTVFDGGARAPQIDGSGRAPDAAGPSDAATMGDAATTGDAARTDDAAPGGRRGPCRSALDCEAGMLCNATTGSCDPIAGFRCLPPASPVGSGSEAQACGGGAMCGEGLRCVDRARALSAETGEYVVTEGLCLRACDPCTMTECADGSACVGLGDGGGACVYGGLGPEGADCHNGVHGPRACVAGTTCVPGNYGSAELFELRRCDRWCTPQARDAWGSRMLTGAASPSPDCEEGTVCVEVGVALAGNLWVCRPGFVIPTGGACGPAIDGYCRWPEICQNRAGLLTTSGTCTPPDSCDCPSGVPCRFAAEGAPFPACVAPGAVLLGGACEEDVDCARGTCQPSVAFRTCQL